LCDVQDLLVELSSVQNILTVFSGKNVLFRSIVHSEWVYLTHLSKNSILSKVPLCFQSNLTRQYRNIR